MEPAAGSGAELPRLRPVSGDASFRRYFRATHGGRSWILMDAPPDKEDCRPFLKIARRFLAAGIPVPEIRAVDLEQGFMCLSDFGDILLWEKLDALRGAPEKAGELYRVAFDELLRIQAVALDAEFSLPPYDLPLLQREMELFRQWLCGGLLELELDRQENRLLDTVFRQLAEEALAQPRVCVHRDYHSRNLMALPDGGIGILDFQDAVYGPVTYDLVSLLKDCYIAWPARQVQAWALEYARMACSEKIIPELDEGAFLRDFALMGMQRHLKAAGIFARLNLRDGKPRYLQDIPRTLGYVRESARAIDGFEAFADWLERRPLPLLEALLPESFDDAGLESVEP